MPAPRVTLSPRNLTARVPALQGVATTAAVACRKGPVDLPFLVTSETDFLRRCTPRERIEPDFDISHWSVITYFEMGGNALWIKRAVASGANAPRYANLLLDSSEPASRGSPNQNLTARPDAPSNATQPVHFYAANPGAWGNQLAVEIVAFDDKVKDDNTGTNAKDNGFAQDGDVRQMRIYNRNELVDTVEISLRRDLRTGFGTNVFVEDALENNEYVRAVSRMLSAADLMGGSVSSQTPTEAVTAPNNLQVETSQTATATGSSQTIVLDQVPTATLAQANIAVSAGTAAEAAAESSSGDVDTDGEWHFDLTTRTLTIQAEVGATITVTYSYQNRQIQLDHFPVASSFEASIASVNFGADNRAASRDAVDIDTPWFLDGRVLVFYTTAAANTKPSVSYTYDNSQIPLTTQRESLAAGDDGGTVSDADFVTALDSFSEYSDIPALLMLDGGKTAPAVTNKIITTCEGRVHSQGLVNVPMNAFADNKRIAAARAVLDDTDQFSPNRSKFVDVTGPWIKILDRFNNRRIWVPMDGAVAGVISRQSRDGEVWQAPSGVNRAVIDIAIDVQSRIKAAEEDILYDQYNINSVILDRSAGFYINGQKTRDSVPNDEDRMNVRLMLCATGPRMLSGLQRFKDEPNTIGTRLLVTAAMESFWADIKARGGVFDFEVICNDTNNTDAVINQSRMVVWVFLWATKISERIEVYPILTSRSVTLGTAEEAFRFAA